MRRMSWKGRLAWGLFVGLAAGGCAGRRSPCCASRASAPVATPAVATPSSAPDGAPPGRSEVELKAAFAQNTRRTPHIPMLGEEEAHAAMPTLFKGRDMPTLMRVGGLQPRTMEALMAFAKQMRTEGGLDGKTLNDAFWAVSSANDCFY